MLLLRIVACRRDPSSSCTTIPPGRRQQENKSTWTMTARKLSVGQKAILDLPATMETSSASGFFSRECSKLAVDRLGVNLGFVFFALFVTSLLLSLPN